MEIYTIGVTIITIIAVLVGILFGYVIKEKEQKP